MNKNKTIWLSIVLIAMFAMIIALAITINEKKWCETLFVLDTLIWQIATTCVLLQNN